MRRGGGHGARSVSSLYLADYFENMFACARVRVRACAQIEVRTNEEKKRCTRTVRVQLCLRFYFDTYRYAILCIARA